MKHETLTPEFVEFVPERLNEGILYVSMMYATAVHKCCCGCGQKVVTPLSPTDWKLQFDGEAVSLTPSIGNWSFPCQSHYWIEGNAIRWAPRWSQDQISAGRAHDQAVKGRYYTPPTGGSPYEGQPVATSGGLLSILKRWLDGA